MLTVTVRERTTSTTVWKNSKVMLILNVTPIVKLSVRRILTVTRNIDSIFILYWNNDLSTGPKARLNHWVDAVGYGLNFTAII